MPTALSLVHGTLTTFGARGYRLSPGRYRSGVLDFCSSRAPPMFLLPGYTKQIYLNRDVAAQGGPAWSIRVTNGNGRTVVFQAFSWSLRAAVEAGVEVRGCGGLGDKMLTPEGPAFWVETTAALNIQTALSSEQVNKLRETWHDFTETIGASAIASTKNG